MRINKKIKTIILYVFLNISTIFAEMQTNIIIEAKATIVRDFLFEEDNFFNHCHASTLLYLDSSEEYIIAWMAGTKEGNDDFSIWLTRGVPTKWKKPIKIAKIRNDAHWNPILFKDEENKIYLFFKVGKEINSWETWIIESIDNGNTWSKPYELVNGDRGGRGPVKNKPIILSNGDIIAGASYEGNHDNKNWDVFVDISKDKGKTWKRSPFLHLDRTNFSGNGVIQPTIWESKNGNIHMMVRSTNGKIYRSDSQDYGETWCDLYPTDLHNNNSSIDIVKLEDNNLFLVYNPIERMGVASRNILSVAASSDNGMSWNDILLLESGTEHEEFSYPSIIKKNDKISITYTYKRKNIVFWEFEVGELDNIPPK